jgi:hypothetical protein
MKFSDEIFLSQRRNKIIFVRFKTNTTVPHTTKLV